MIDAPMMLGSNFLNSLSMFQNSNDLSELYNVTPAVPTKFSTYNLYSGRSVMGVHGYPVLNGGMFPRISNIIGESATGKSSILVQLTTGAVDYIVEKFGLGYAELIYFDNERNMDAYRFCDLAKWGPADFQMKCHFSQKDLTIVELADFIIKRAENKVKYAKDYMIPTGMRDLNGREVMFYAPTYICVDSIASVNPEGVEDLVEKDKAGEIKEITSLGTNMDAAREANAWTIFTRKMKPWLDKGNIGLYFINHKTKEIKTSMYEQQTRYLPFLKVGEKIKGGKELIFQSYNIFSLASSDKLNERNPIYGPDITGFIANGSFVKNKVNVEGIQFPMVFDQSRGYMPDLSDFEYLYQKKFGFDGSVKMRMDILPEVEFSRRTLHDTIQEYPQLARAIQFTTRYYGTNTMFYKAKPLSLKSVGENVPLERRLSMIYNFTHQYDRSIYDDQYKNFVELAHANRHYYTFGFDSDFRNTIVTNENIDDLDNGYTLLPGKGISPYSADLGECEIIDGHYMGILPTTGQNNTKKK